MMKRVIMAALLVAVCLPDVALAQGGMSSVSAIAAQIQVMQVNDVLRTKVRHEEDLKAAGIESVKPGDEVVLEKNKDGSVAVRHVTSGQCGVLAPGE